MEHVGGWRGLIGLLFATALVAFPLTLGLHHAVGDHVPLLKSTAGGWMLALILWAIAILWGLAAVIHE